VIVPFPMALVTVQRFTGQCRPISPRPYTKGPAESFDGPLRTGGMSESGPPETTELFSDGPPVVRLRHGVTCPQAH
jgi:hypothetical protein